MSPHSGSQSGDVLARVIAALSDLDTTDQARVLRAVNTYFEDGTPPVRSAPWTDPAPSLTNGSVGGFSADRRPTPKVFLHEKEPKTDVERIACLAYYLTHYRDLPLFKTPDLTKLNTEAAQVKFSNASFAAANALKTGYLAAAERGKRQLSAAGERFVEALPNRDAARLVMTSSRRPKKRTKSNRKKAAKVA